MRASAKRECILSIPAQVRRCTTISVTPKAGFLWPRTACCVCATCMRVAAATVAEQRTARGALAHREQHAQATVLQRVCEAGGCSGARNAEGAGSRRGIGRIYAGVASARVRQQRRNLTPGCQRSAGCGAWRGRWRLPCRRETCAKVSETNQVGRSTSECRQCCQHARAAREFRPLQHITFI